MNEEIDVRKIVPQYAKDILDIELFIENNCETEKSNELWNHILSKSKLNKSNKQ
ncbi:MAG: hypothetical protein WC877_01220 [Dehalococcoidales bacterium]|jgi:hypothetical protein